MDAGGNMAAALLAETLGGMPFIGFIAVVAGLTLTGAAALLHDLWVSVVRHGHTSRGEQLRVARVATAVLGVVAVLLGITFKGQNVAYMVSLVFAGGQRELPSAGAVGVLAPEHDQRHGRQHGAGHGVHADADLPVADRSD